MEPVIQELKKGYETAVEFFLSECAGIRTGRATPALVEHLPVAAYGGTSAMREVAAIAVGDARTIVIQPWDATLIEAISKAIIDAELGIMPNVQETRIILSLPQLTTERREELVKILGKRLEDARVTGRAHRDDARSAVMKAEKDKEISEDEKFRRLEEIEKLAGAYQARLEEITAKKEAEITTL